mmetsp:Transcript_58783/g.165863  ORF Transcript_58783/g.165863 Transcript_58783/m.165863 type:complete len:374 (-) Transcript_58783:1753-2874(-)
MWNRRCLGGRPAPTRSAICSARPRQRPWFRRAKNTLVPMCSRVAVPGVGWKLSGGTGKAEISLCKDSHLWRASPLSDRIGSSVTCLQRAPCLSRMNPSAGSDSKHCRSQGSSQVRFSTTPCSMERPSAWPLHRGSFSQPNPSHSTRTHCAPPAPSHGSKVNATPVICVVSAVAVSKCLLEMDVWPLQRTLDLPAARAMYSTSWSIKCSSTAPPAAHCSSSELTAEPGALPKSSVLRLSALMTPPWEPNATSWTPHAPKLYACLSRCRARRCFLVSGPQPSSKDAAGPGAAAASSCGTASSMSTSTVTAALPKTPELESSARVASARSFASGLAVPRAKTSARTDTASPRARSCSAVRLRTELTATATSPPPCG